MNLNKDEYIFGAHWMPLDAESTTVKCTGGRYLQCKVHFELQSVNLNAQAPCSLKLSTSISKN